MPQTSTVDEGPPTLAVADGVATVRLRRPAQRNSLHDEDLQRLLEIFAALDADPAVRVLVLSADTTGQRKPVFCSGYNVGGFDSGKHDPRLFEQIPDALEALRPISVCTLNGSVYGGATDIVLACDLRIGLVGSDFRMPAAALGLHYYPSGLRRYVSRLGLNGAKRAFLTAQAMTIESLGTAGPVRADRLPAVRCGCDTWCNRWLRSRHWPRRPPNARSTRSPPAASTKRACASANPTLASADFAEGRAAFAEKRAPRSSHRPLRRHHEQDTKRWTPTTPRPQAADRRARGRDGAHHGRALLR